MARLPIPGGDVGNWGKILNEFLEVEHNADGTLKSGGSLASKYTKPAGGIPNSDLHPDVSDAISDAQKAASLVKAFQPEAGTIVVGGPDGEPIKQGFGGSFLPLRNVRFSALSAGNIAPIDAIGGTLYGRPVGVGPEIAQLHRSLDSGATWEHVSTVGGSAISAVRQLGNGELLVAAGQLWVSSGWSSNPYTATWAVAATPTPADGGNPAAAFIPFTLDVWDRYVLVGEYCVPRNNSRKLRFSQDYGQTFVDLLDLNALYPGQEANTHWHAAAIDHWADTPSGIRLWAVHGDGPRSMRYSDDLGQNWTMFNEGDWQFTTMTATPHGMVCCTDEVPDGVYRILRTANPADMTLEPMHLIRRGGGPGALYGFAQRSFYQESTGLVYIAFNSNWAGIPSFVFVSDGVSADAVWESPIGATAGSECQLISAVDGGRVHWQFRQSEEGVNYHVSADLVSRGGRSTQEVIRDVLGGTNDKNSVVIGYTPEHSFASVVVGENIRSPSDAGYNVQIGHGATADSGVNNSVIAGASARSGAHNTVVIGHGADAEGHSSVLVGKSTKGRTNSVAIGDGASSRGADDTTEGASGIAIGRTASNYATSGGVAIGWNATTANVAASGIAIGAGASAQRPSSIAIGGSSTGHQGVAVGGAAVAGPNSWAVALGREASATHESAVALGRATATSANNQVAFGPRHLEISQVSNPSAPAADKARLFVRDNGNGKTELCVRFATGAIQVIATEP